MGRRKKGAGKKRRKQYKGRNRHHLVNKCQGGSNHISNLLLIDILRHRWWHKIFKNLSWEQAIRLMIRTHRIKQRQKESEDALPGQEVSEYGYGRDR